MKTEQEKIEEMAQVIRTWKDTNDINYRFGTHYANMLYKAGYRKANDVIDELVKNIMTDAEPFLSNMSRNLIRMCASKMKKELAVEMRKEVEK